VAYTPFEARERERATQLESERACARQPLCGRRERCERLVSPVKENAQVLIFRARAQRRMAFPEWQKSKPAWNEHTGVPDRYRTAEPHPDTPHNHRKTRRSRKPEETPTPDPKAQQSARLCSPCCSCRRSLFCAILRCRRSQFAPSCAAAAPILLPLALPPLPFCSLLRCRRSHFAPSCAAAAPILLPLALPPPLPFCSLLHCRHRSGFASSLALHLATAHLRRPLGVCIERCLPICDPSISGTRETTRSVLSSARTVLFCQSSSCSIALCAVPTTEGGIRAHHR
jgi:hypothetical protein